MVCCGHAKHRAIETELHTASPLFQVHPDWNTERGQGRGAQEVTELPPTNENTPSVATGPQWAVSKTIVLEAASQWSTFLNWRVISNKCQVCEPTESPVTPLRNGRGCKHQVNEKELPINRSGLGLTTLTNTSAQWSSLPQFSTTQHFPAWKKVCSIPSTR